MLQFLVLREQTQRRVIRTIGQRVKKMRDGEQGASQHVAMHRGNLLGIGRKLAQCNLQLGTKRRCTVQADHFQHAQQTVQLGTH